MRLLLVLLAALALAACSSGGGARSSSDMAVDVTLFHTVLFCELSDCQFEGSSQGDT